MDKSDERTMIWPNQSHGIPFRSGKRVGDSHARKSLEWAKVLDAGRHALS